MVAGPAGVPLALDDGADAAKLGDDVDALVPDGADVADAPAGAAEHLGAVLLVVDRAHGGDVEAEDPLALALAPLTDADDIEAG